MENKLLNDYLGKSKSINFGKSIWITKILVSAILLLLSLIFVKNDDNNTKLFKKYLFENNFNFSKFNNIYQSLKQDNFQVEPVSLNIKYSNKQNYHEGISLKVSDSLIETFNSGIVVYIGKKDNYNNTIIIQGSDGYDIWYGNIEDINVQLYDYIDKNTIIGQTNNLFIKVLKDGKVIKADEYLHI